MREGESGCGTREGEVLKREGDKGVAAARLGLKREGDRGCGTELKRLGLILEGDELTGVMGVGRGAIMLEPTSRPLASMGCKPAWDNCKDLGDDINIILMG